MSRPAARWTCSRSGPRTPSAPACQPTPESMSSAAPAATPGEVSTGTPITRPSCLDPHVAYLQQRWNEGCRSTSMLLAELRARGYPGSLRTLRGHTADLRQAAAWAVAPPPPAPRTVASWILTAPGKLTDADRTALRQLTARCEET